MRSGMLEIKRIPKDIIYWNQFSTLNNNFVLYSKGRFNNKKNCSLDSKNNTGSVFKYFVVFLNYALRNV